MRGEGSEALSMGSSRGAGSWGPLGCGARIPPDMLILEPVEEYEVRYMLRGWASNIS